MYGVDQRMIILQLFFNKLPIIIVNYWFVFVKTFFINQYILAEISENTKQPNMATFLLTISLIGGTIIVTLVYVSWRKYRGEQNKKRTHHKSKH